jgi:branched-chain amino acid transport system ATP-binding protein
VTAALETSGRGPLLACAGVDVAYGSVQVLFGVDLVVDEGEIVALRGSTGAGKSTLLRAVTGLSRPRAGTVIFDGEDITSAEPAEVAARGVSFMPGGRAIFPGLTVAENLELAGWLHRKRADPAEAEEEVNRVLELFPALRTRLSERAALLSGGQQQMLALAQALLTHPRLLLIDELSLGLAPVVVGELMEVVRRLRDDGVTIVVVEQSVNVALELADRAVFMEKGEVRFTGPADDLADRADLLRSVFIGGSGVRARPSRPRPVPGSSASEPILRARGLRVAFGGVVAVDDVDLDVLAGDVVGIIGPNGAGKTTLFDVLSGFVRPSTGRISFDGVDITTLAVEERAWLGIARTFQDARLFPGLTVAENLAVALERFTTNRDPVAAAMRLPAALLSEVLIERQVDELVGLLGLTAFRDKHVSQLSTGTRRIVELGSLVAQRARLMLLDEPSAGIAQKEAEALGPLLVRIRDATGAALVIVEHDIPLLSGACDEMVAMDVGRVISKGTPAEVVSDPLVVASYLGTATAAIDRSGRGAAARPRRRPLRASAGVS